MIRFFVLFLSFCLASCATASLPPEGEAELAQGFQTCVRLLSTEIAARKELDVNPAAGFALATPSAIEDDAVLLYRCLDRWVPVTEPLHGVMLRRRTQLMYDHALSVRGEKVRPLGKALSESVWLHNDQDTVQRVIKDREAAAARKAVKLAAKADDP